MKYLWMLILIFLFNGCLYFNDTGVSTRLYQECKEYYDANGNYHKTCPKNLIDYTDFDQ